ncbi:hypothetical protein U3A55_11970 [Salarchaeum sp. III]|uniref:hypothetical protein n=1 Tax=Salarchaeum sp. III TaxID=3107927 RepID=UPI002ED7B178
MDADSDPEDRDGLSHTDAQTPPQDRNLDILGVSITEQQWVAVGSIIGIFGGFLPWIKLTSAFGTATRTGMSGDGKYAVLLLLIAGGVAVLTDWDKRAALGTAVLAGLAALLPLLYLIDPGLGVGTIRAGYLERGTGLMLSFVGAVLVTWVSWRRKETL